MRKIKKQILLAAILLLLLFAFNTYGYFHINRLTLQNRNVDKASSLLKSQEALSDDMVQTMVVLSIHQSFDRATYNRQVDNLRNKNALFLSTQKSLDSFIQTITSNKNFSTLQTVFDSSRLYSNLLTAQAKSVINGNDTFTKTYAFINAVRDNESSYRKARLTINNSLTAAEDNLEDGIAFWNNALIFSLLTALVLVCVLLLAPSLQNSIKNQQQLQESLKESKKSEAMLRTIIDASPDMIFIVDKQQKFRLVNKVMAKRKGRQPAEFIGKSELEMGMDPAVVLGDPARNIKGLWHYNNEVMESGEPKFFAEEEIRLQGKTKYVSTTKAPLKDDNGNVWGLMGFIHDFTERVEAERKLKESENKYRSLFDYNPLPMWIFDLHTNKFLEVNEQAVEHYGYSKKEFTAMSIFDIRPPETQSDLQEVIQSRSDDSFNFRGTWAHQKKNGEKIFVEIISHKIEYNNVEAMLVLANDVTRQIELQNELCNEKIAHQKEIAKATIDVQEKQRDEIGKELHDNVNQILTSAKLYIDCITADAAETETYRKTGVQLIGNAISEIRRLSKTLVPPSLKDIGLASSIQELLDGIYFTQNIACGFIQTDFNEAAIDEGLKLTIYRIIQEQTTNVLKYAAASSLTIRITHKPTHLDLIIEDDGRGFDTSLHRKGVGITNISNRANIYHGDVMITSTPGTGCSLQVSFQLAANDINTPIT